MATEVSIVIPVYYAGDQICRCARSLFSQTMRELEFIFVDDASGDDSIDRLKSVIGEFPHRKEQVKILHNEHNLGPLGARKRAIAAATGKYVAFCDADDYVEPDMIELMYRKGEECGAEIVHCGLTMHHINGKIDQKIDSVSTTDYRRLVLAENCGNITPYFFTHMFRREVLSLEKFYLPDSITFTEDLLMIFQIMRFCRKAVSIPQCEYHYLRAENSICHRNRQKNIRLCFRVLNFLDRTETDREVLKARKTRWRNFLYTVWKKEYLSPIRIHAMVKYCGKGALFDRNLKWKKRISLSFLWLKATFCSSLAWKRKGSVCAKALSQRNIS